HGVQFYENDGFFVARVSKYLLEGIMAGDRIIAVVTPAHRKQLEASVEAELGRKIAPSEIQFVDALAMLEKFMVDERPDAARFDAALDALLACEPTNTRPLRLFGEMVDMLTRGGNIDAACELEDLWNLAAGRQSFQLLCAYVLDGFPSHARAAALARICAAHDRVLPAEDFDPDPHDDAGRRVIAGLEERAAGLEREVAHRREIEEQLRASIERERAARAVAEANDAFKEEFLAMLGHDLRNPLNTVLTTVRLMLMEDDVAPQHERRLKRVVASGVRMQRMIEQLLDVTRARLSNGIPVNLGPCDASLLVASIIEEAKGATPDRVILFTTEGSCPALLDADRLGQVVSNLLGNAITYGDPQKAIEVTARREESRIKISVRNFGSPIDDALLPQLFEPFTRRPAAASRSAGLGLGLYISDQIVRGHGGSIRVSSSAKEGTCFEVELPCK
ncbi:MAG: ATP-binding protein, partial [Polyangiaceae bacterium]